MLEHAGPLDVPVPQHRFGLRGVSGGESSHVREDLAHLHRST
ncbi:hypothetical protein [Rhodococcus wratislaviensis]|nr:hypothetical protein [Rhodococcus wratislaviensis]